MVEVLGRYSNLADQGERIRTLLEIVPEGAQDVKHRTPRQVQRRLKPDELAKLTRLYHEGMKIDDLALEMQIHRATIFELIHRGVLVRRPRGIRAEDISAVVDAYNAGASLSQLGKKYGVPGSTVRNALLRSGVTPRPRVGWNYS